MVPVVRMNGLAFGRVCNYLIIIAIVWYNTGLSIGGICKPKDMDKYLAGELVEPVKPIVWYVDPAIPEKWRKYVKLGIADWNIAFEAIGFKNAIVVKDYPTDDPNFDPDDIPIIIVIVLWHRQERELGRGRRGLILVRGEICVET